MPAASVLSDCGRAVLSGWHAAANILGVACAAASLTVSTAAVAASFDESMAMTPSMNVTGETESVLVPRSAGADMSGAGAGTPFDSSAVMMQNPDGSWAVDGDGQGACERCGGLHDGDCPDLGFSPASGIINRCLGDACPRWVIQADALMLWRGLVPSRPLFYGEPEPLEPPVPYLNLNEINAPLTVGPRVALLLNIDRCYAIEANYFYLNGFDGSGSIPNDGTPYVMNNLAGNNLGSITEAQALTTGAIQSFELNWRRWNGRSLTWLAGFRWVEWNEGLTVTSQFEDPEPDPPATGTDYVTVENQNDLFGGQVGVDAILLTLYNRVRFNGIAKAGLYGNWNARSTLTAGGDSIGPPETFSFSSTPVAFVGEVGVNGTVRLTQHWFVRAGYNFFWLSGLATAGPQLDSVDTTLTEPSTINDTGTVFLNGLNVGTEFIW